MRLRLCMFGIRLLAINGLLAFCTVGQLRAQISNTGNISSKGLIDNQKVVSKDSTGFAEKAEDQSVQIYYENSNGKRFHYDTSILELHHLNLLNKWEIDLGNAGSAYQSIKAMAELPIAYTLLPQQQQAYRYTMSALSYFNTTKPVSEVRYSAGSKQEQLVELFHTQNIRPSWNFSTRYRKINSLGYYQAQKNNIDNFSFISHYQSSKRPYLAEVAVLYNKLQQDENLGILSDTFFTNDRYSNLSLIPVRVNVLSGVTRSPILNYRRDVNVQFKQEYAIGKHEEKLIHDTVKTTVFKPLVSFTNRVYYNAERYLFQHNQPDSIFRQEYFSQIYPLNDTLKLTYNNQVFGTSFAAEGNVYIRERIFSLQAGLGIEYQQLGGDVRTQRSVNNYLFASLNNRKSADSSWQLDANLTFYFTGMARGNLHLTGDLSRTFSERAGTIGFRAAQYIQQPFFVSESLQFGGYEALFPLQPQINTRLGGYYKQQPLRLEIGVNALLLNQLIYVQGFQPDYQQYNKAIQITQAEIKKDFSLGKWVSSNVILIQLSPENTPVNIPLFASFHRIAFNDYLFNGKLEVSTGLDLFYNTPYFFDNYQPVFQNFSPQTNVEQLNFPRLQPFFNFRIKRFRASVSVDQLQHTFVKNNQNYNLYGAQNSLFRFGLRWLFVN